MEPNAVINRTVHDKASHKFVDTFGCTPTVAAYAPGRIEVLGNHTDYNEGWVLSAAIDLGTFFLVGPGEGPGHQCFAADVMQQARFDAVAPQAVAEPAWANYVIGMVAGLRKKATVEDPFKALFLGNLPLGAGLSSSAALEMAAGLGLSAFYGVELAGLDMARIGQSAEHDFAGVNCGLMDQISSLFGKRNSLVMTDFRTLEVEHVSLPEDALFLMCNTRVKHALVDGEYNRRRKQCEKAVAFFASRLDHPVSALRDVSEAEWGEFQGEMEPETARQALHPIGENARVLRGRELLHEGDLEAFGRLMFASHESSQVNFENSCRELDFLVNAARKIPGILGARLSGGGFGGSVVMLVRPPHVAAAIEAIVSAYTREFGHPCETQVVTPSDGAFVV